MNTKLLNKLRIFLNTNRNELLDIILFGSTVKGKEKPKDTDIILIFRNKENEEVAHNLRKTIAQHNPDITTKTYKNLYDNFTAKESILKEGYSIQYNAFIAEKAGYKSMILIKYNLKNKTKNEKNKFYFSLTGRNGNKGMTQIIHIKKFTNNTILCNIEKIEETREYLKTQKIEYEEIPIIIPKRII